MHKKDQDYLNRTLITSSSRVMACDSEQQRLLLVGGGHAHIQVIKALNCYVRPTSLNITLIDRVCKASYSGMVPGCLAGVYQPEETQIDLAAVCQWAGTTFIKGELTDINLESKRAIYRREDGSQLHQEPFDVISLDLGSASRDLSSVPGAYDHTIPTRPIQKLVEHATKMRNKWKKADSITPNLVVVGGGVAGIELAMSIAGRWKAEGPNKPFQCTILDSGTELLPDESIEARDQLQEVLVDIGITVIHGVKVKEVSEEKVFLASSISATTPDSIFYTDCIWATGAGSHQLAKNLAAAGLSLSEQGWIRVGPTFQSISHPFVFAAGDCAQVELGESGKRGLPKAGVFAVRAGPVLVENLIRQVSYDQTQLIEYQPQSEYMKLLVCGAGKALGFRFGLAFYGRWVMQMKDAIDRSFMGQFREDNLPDPAVLRVGVYDTSQFDFAKNDTKIPSVCDAANLLQRNDDDVDFREAWSILRAMAGDPEYCSAVKSVAEKKGMM